MSFRDAGDLGTRLVAGIYQMLRISDHWSTERDRGFIWWPSLYAQTIYSDLPNFHTDSALYRIHCETELVRGRGHHETCELPIAQAMASATLSAVIYDSKLDLYKLHCSVYANEQNFDWARRVFLVAAALQAIDANRGAPRLAQTFDLAAAQSEHPKAGLRNTPDPLLQADEQYLKPAGQAPSKWLEAGEEWLDARDRVRRIGSHAVTDGKSYLQAEFEWEGLVHSAPMRLEIRADQPHPLMGNGLKIVLTLPVLMPSKDRAHTAVEFNTLERTEWNWCHDLGSWCVEGSDLAFHAFIPNISFASGMLSDFSHDMALRANWANRHLEATS